MTEGSIEPFAQAHLDGLIALVTAEGWTEYTDDVDRTYRALIAPGVTTLVAIGGGQVVGAIQVQSDGVIQAYYERLGAARSLGFRLTREHLGLSPEAA